MKNTRIIFICIALFSFKSLSAQVTPAQGLSGGPVRFITNGTIEFDKNVNMWAMRQKSIIKGSTFETVMQQAYEQYKKTQPQFKVLKSSLAFSGDKSLFTPVPDNTVANNPTITQLNTTYTDFTTNTSINQKDMMGQILLIKDSPRKINWKITSETRDIAGFTCRRANALIMDSIYVVAFYTDEILVTGGPESFTGLPGMILGVALPHENLTWFATKVTTQTVPALVAPAKGKAMTTQEFINTLKGLTKNMPVVNAQPTLKALLL